MTYLKIAIQKSGRLNEDSLNLLKECGISINNGADQLMAQASNFPLEVLYLRNSDIPQYVRDGVADVAILGENTEIEKRTGNRRVLPLGFSRCRVSMAVPRDVPYEGLSYFQGKKIATSYPNTLSDFLKREGIQAEIHEISGSVEIAPGIGLAHAIFDIVSSGSTLFKNGLKEVYKVLDSQAVLLANPDLSPEKQALLQVHPAQCTGSVPGEDLLAASGNEESDDHPLAGKRLGVDPLGGERGKVLGSDRKTERGRCGRYPDRADRKNDSVRRYC